jgi:hypothetical protein
MRYCGDAVTSVDGEVQLVYIILVVEEKIK